MNAEEQKKYRVGSVPFLNAKPLTQWFHSPYAEMEAELIYDVPSRLAERLTRRKISAGLISSYESFRRPDTTIIPDISISSYGAVESVRLFSKVPFDKIETLALDSGSLTSSALAQIILAELYGVKPRVMSKSPVLDTMLIDCDAGLLIGDAGLIASGEGLQILDLGEAWTDWVGLPFVWAVWLANEEEPIDDLTQMLQAAKEYGKQAINEIIALESIRLPAPESLVRKYLTQTINYNLGEDHLISLKYYKELCVRHSLLNGDVEVKNAVI